jgi:hypothetical protein
MSQAIAQEGMAQFMKCTSGLGMADVELLSLLFELLGQLAFVRENLKIIVQHGGIRVLLLIMGVEDYQREVSHHQLTPAVLCTDASVGRVDDKSHRNA